MRDNQYLFSIAVFCSILVMSIILFIVLFIIMYRQKMIRIHLQQQEAEHNRNSELLKTRIEVQEQTLNHIARELHDNIGQEVSTAKVILKNLDHKPKDLPETRRIIKESVVILDKVYEDMRLVSHSLKGYNIEEVGWIEAIEKELYYMREYGQIHTHLQYLDNEVELVNSESDKALLLFRIIQECLQNIMKHAQASEVHVILKQAENKGLFNLLNITVRDNGIGMDTTKVNKGMGLLNMEQRVKMLAGKMKIISNTGNGTTIMFHIPITTKSLNNGEH